MGPAEFFASVARTGALEAARRRGSILFEISGSSGGRWLLRLGSGVEHPARELSAELVVRISGDRFDRFVSGRLDVVREVEQGSLVLAGDLDLLDELARAFRPPLSLIELRSGRGG